jgi:predicted integral membrane protein DUF2269
VTAGLAVLIIHVLLAFAAVAFLLVPGYLLAAVAKTDDVKSIRRIFSVGVFHGRVGGIIAVFTAIFGLAAAPFYGIPYSARWMIASYVLFAALVAIGIGYHARWEMRVLALANQSPADAPSAQLHAAAHDRRGPVMAWISSLLFVAIIYLMIARPF